MIIDSGWIWDETGAVDVVEWISDAISGVSLKTTFRFGGTSGGLGADAGTGGGSIDENPFRCTFGLKLKFHGL